MAQMRECKQQYGQSVRQQSVRNMSTKDRPGTLPVNAYEDETVNTKMFDFTVLQRDALPCSNWQDKIEISQRSKDAETLDMPSIVAKKGEFAACSKNGFAPKGLASKPCPFFSSNSKGTSWRVTLSRDKTVSGSSRTFCHSILLNLASRTRCCVTWNLFSSIQFHSNM